MEKFEEDKTDHQDNLEIYEEEIQGAAVYEKDQLNVPDEPEIQQNEGGDEGLNSGSDDENVELNEKALQILNFSDLEKQTFRNMFPSRNLFTFENGMNITSNFDSGNLLKCTKGNAFEEVPGEKYFNKPNDKDEMFYAFDMWVCPDAWPYMTEVTAG